MSEVVYANVEPWLVPHLPAPSRVIPRIGGRDVTELREADVIVLGIEGMVGFADLGVTLDLLQSLVDSGATRRFVLLSSYTVYRPSTSPHVEDGPRAPLNFVGTKAYMMENALMYYQRRYELSLTVLRLFNLYGLHQPRPCVVPTVLGHIVRGTPLRTGDSDKSRDFLHVSDFIDLLKAVLATSAAGCATFNAGSGTSTSIRELVDLAGEVSGSRAEVLFDATRLREEFDHDHVVADITAAKEAFGWEPRVPLREGLALTHRWFVGRAGISV